MAIQQDKVKNVVSALEAKAETSEQSVKSIDDLLSAFAAEEDPIDPEDKWMVANYVFDLLAQMRENEKQGAAYRDAAEMIKNELFLDNEQDKISD